MRPGCPRPRLLCGWLPSPYLCRGTWEEVIWWWFSRNRNRCLTHLRSSSSRSGNPCVQTSGWGHSLGSDTAVVSKDRSALWFAGLRRAL